MGKKYIIELEEAPFVQHFENGAWETIYRVKGFNSLVFDWNGLNMLTPYTEPDLEQVRKEAYENGYENGFVAGHLKAEKSGQSFYEDGYQCGLNDAWECARKICLEDDDGGIPASAINDIFSVRNYRNALRDFSASECIEKIRQYEQEKEEIKVGDEVKGGDEKYIVLQKYLNNIDELMVVLFNTKNGEIDKWHLNNTNGAIFEKTGRHFPEIAEVFAKMGEK